MSCPNSQRLTYEESRASCHVRFLTSLVFGTAVPLDFLLEIQPEIEMMTLLLSLLPLMGINRKISRPLVRLAILDPPM